MGDPKTCVYQFIYDENYNDDTKLIQYFIMHVLGLWKKVDSYVSHMLYSWSFSHNTVVLIATNKRDIFFPWIQTLPYLLGDMEIPIKKQHNNKIH